MFSNFVSSLSVANFQWDNILAPVDSFNQVFIQSANTQIACTASVRTKQLGMRCSTFSGAFNLAFTGAYGYFTQGTIYTAVQALMASGSSCSDLGKNLGLLVSELLEAKTPSNVFYNQVASASS